MFCLFLGERSLSIRIYLALFITTILFVIVICLRSTIHVLNVKTKFSHEIASHKHKHARTHTHASEYTEREPVYLA